MTLWRKVHKECAEVSCIIFWLFCSGGSCLLCEEIGPLGDATTLLFLRMSSVSGKRRPVFGWIGLLLGRIDTVVGRIVLVSGPIDLVAGRIGLVVGRFDRVVERIGLVVGRIGLVVGRIGPVFGRFDIVVGRIGLLRRQIGMLADRIGVLGGLFGVPGHLFEVLVGRIGPLAALSGMVGERIRTVVLPIDWLPGQIDELFGMSVSLLLATGPVGEHWGSGLGPSNGLFGVSLSVGLRIGRVWQ